MAKARQAKRRTKIIVCQQKSSASANTDGQIPEDEQELYQRWAEAIPLSAAQGRSERFQAQQMMADVTWIVRMRYDELTAAITPAMWLKIKTTSQRLNIRRAYDPNMRRRTIEIECTERK